MMREKNMEYTLRECIQEDLQFICDLKEKCFKWYIEKIYGWDENQLELTQKEMDENLSYMNVIQYENKDIGLFTFSYDENGDGRIGMFAILPEYQGKGIGTKILQDTIEKNPGVRMYLKTYKENPARFLYQRLGFQKYDETETHWLMEKNMKV